ncbi:Gfo/Idh/MocA family protein [Caulobacter sp. S45]|uniref:Gfo/Idh/MocA family protein n=1 Tax=Caulobacter sp. S45 TaxID=1641861 RepID=UPI00157675D4|nr:Gfo/Idh/MocA family oxidoreductase [Caulobacter sp. S45]
MPPYKLAIIGYGKIAQDQHLLAIQSSGVFELAAVTSGHAKTIPGVEKVFSKDAQMYAEAPEVACVAICSAPAKRFDAARRALLAGKHVLLEKPPAATLGEARALVNLAQSHGLTLFGAWHARANPAVVEAAARLKGEQVATLSVTWKEDVRKWHPGQEWVWDAGGFGVFDPGINALSIVTAILPAEVFVRTAKLSIPSNRQSPIAVELGFGSEPPGDILTAIFDWRQTGPQTWNIEIQTRSGRTLLLTEGGAKLEVDGQTVKTAPSREYPDLYARFAELLAKGASDADLRPLELVADAFMCGERQQVEPFSF